MKTNKERSESPPKYHDLDWFFGTWSKEEHQRVLKFIREQRKIEKDLWR